MQKIEAAFEKAERLHKKVEVFILTCVGSDGYPLTKAVIPGKYRDSLKELYFTTNTSSRFVNEVSKNSKASVYFYIQELSWDGCMLKGDFEIVTDLKLKEKYWIEDFKEAYNEQSFTCPDFCLLRFVPKSGRFYSKYTLEDFGV